MLILCIFTFLIGIIIGSFLNVCIYRLPLGQSIVVPPSHCMSCNKRLGVKDLVPILSYVFLRGKCRHCGVGFSPRYALVELLTGLLFAGVTYVVGLSPLLIAYLIFTAFMVVIIFIDYDHQLILDKVLLPFAVIGVIINYLFGNIVTMEPFGWNVLYGALTGGGILLAIAIGSLLIAKQEGMGMGDVKFAAALGIWLGWQLTLEMLFLSFLFGGIGGIVCLLFLGKGRKTMIPFGPYIAIAALTTVLYGLDIIRWYWINFVVR